MTLGNILHIEGKRQKLFREYASHVFTFHTNTCRTNFHFLKVTTKEISNWMPVDDTFCPLCYPQTYPILFVVVFVANEKHPQRFPIPMPSQAKLFKFFLFCSYLNPLDKVSVSRRKKVNPLDRHQMTYLEPVFAVAAGDSVTAEWCVLLWDFVKRSGSGTKWYMWDAVMILKMFWFSSLRMWTWRIFEKKNWKKKYLKRFCNYL